VEAHRHELLGSRAGGCLKKKAGQVRFHVGGRNAAMEASLEASSGPSRAIEDQKHLVTGRGFSQAPKGAGVAGEEIFPAGFRELSSLERGANPTSRIHPEPSLPQPSIGRVRPCSPPSAGLATVCELRRGRATIPSPTHPRHLGVTCPS